MIHTFADDRAEAILEGEVPRRFPSDILRRALTKLRLLNAAGMLDDLRVPPGNRLEALADDRLGQHSIRINDQWRICFIWKDDGAYEVEIVDYH